MLRTSANCPLSVTNLENTSVRRKNTTYVRNQVYSFDNSLTSVLITSLPLA